MPLARAGGGGGGLVTCPAAGTTHYAHTSFHRCCYGMRASAFHAARLPRASEPRACHYVCACTYRKRLLPFYLAHLYCLPPSCDRRLVFAQTRAAGLGIAGAGLLFSTLPWAAGCLPPSRLPRRCVLLCAYAADAHALPSPRTSATAFTVPLPSDRRRRISTAYGRRGAE